MLFYRSIFALSLILKPVTMKEQVYNIVVITDCRE